MREHDWNGATPDIGVHAILGNTRGTRLASPPAVTVSGDIDALSQRHANVKITGLTDSCEHDSRLIRIARDRALWLNPPSTLPPEGWHSGVAISSGGGYALIELDGPGALHLLAQGTTVNLAQPSPSAAILFANQPSLLCKHGTAWWLFVAEPLVAFHWRWLLAADRGT